MAKPRRDKKHVHRKLHFGRPLGADVAAFLDAVHRELAHRKLGFLFGGKTVNARRHSIARTIFALGLTDKARRAALEGNVGTWTQRKVRNPILRSPLDRVRARRRRKVLRRWRRNHRDEANVTVMYDSVTLSEIPEDAPAVAGYTGGMWPTYWELDELFPHAKHVSIAVRSREDADVLDIEPGNATPADAAAWVKRQQQRRKDDPGFYNLRKPGVYAAVSDMPTILTALANAGIQRDDVLVWTAHIGQGEHRCGPNGCGWPGLHDDADATQWTWTALGRNLDQSTLGLSFF